MFDNWEWFVFVVGALFFFGWFALGMQWNIRKGNNVLRWLRDGLPVIGEKTTMRWLGSSVVELKIEKARDPFRNAETLVVLEPRDVSLLWAFYRARGRRDLLIFRAQTRASPSFELEAIDPKAWTTHGIERDVQGKGWHALQIDGGSGLNVYLANEVEANRAKTLLAQTMNMGGKLVRLSVHRTVPNLEAHWLLPDTNALAARDWFIKLSQVCKSASD